MKIPTTLVMLSLTVTILINFRVLHSNSFIVSAQNSQKFLSCLQSSSQSDELSQLIFSPQNSTYKSVFLSGIQNLRIVSPKMPQPAFVITPENDPQIQTLISCSKSSAFPVRVRSGGHDYEGLSSTSAAAFVLIDLKKLDSVEIDAGARVAWVGAGARLGKLYYKIAEKSEKLGFPAGMCPTIGAGGHFSGGGLGTITRRHGLAADNILDARIVTADGRILEGKSMSEDLFWAIRGGGAGSFGVVTAWKIRLVPVPEIVTVFTKFGRNSTRLVHQWQYVAHKFDQDLYIRAVVSSSIEARFDSLFLGKTDRLLDLMREGFPELGLAREDCIEMSWIESVVYFSDLPQGSAVEDLVRKTAPYPKTHYKIKSDLVTSPIPDHAFDGLRRRFAAAEGRDAQLMLAPFGGRMSEIPETETPFPHRDGNIYIIQYMVFWDEDEDDDDDDDDDDEKGERYVDWIREVYDYMAPFVSRNPRAAYLNYRDLDLGVNDEDDEEEASVWGIKYFKSNFRRLIGVKSEVDPHNFFRDEQSIPIVYSGAQARADNFRHDYENTIRTCMKLMD